MDPSSSFESLSMLSPSIRKSTRFSTQSKKAAQKKPTIKNQKVWTSPTVSAFLSVFFKSSSYAKLWASVSKRTLVGEPTFLTKDFEHSGILELLGETNLIGFLLKPHPFVT